MSPFIDGSGNSSLLEKISHEMRENISVLGNKGFGRQVSRLKSDHKYAFIFQLGSITNIGPFMIVSNQVVAN